LNRSHERGHGPYTPRPLYCMYHGNETDQRTKDCPIYIDTKLKMNQDTTQPCQQLQSREVNHTKQWAPHSQKHSPSYPLHYPPYKNSQTQSPAYYQSYHYATINHPQPPPTPQITYHPALPQITYPAPNNTNTNQVKAEQNPPLPPSLQQAQEPLQQPKNFSTHGTIPTIPQQAQEPLQQPRNFSTHGTIPTITGGSNTDFETKRQCRDYYQQVNHVTVEGPITKTKWSHIPITFSSQDINLTSCTLTPWSLQSTSIDGT
jgi:hypothetical protein